jgi:hypothetical protein
MTIVATEDSRNSEWKNGNKGASLLRKMGWTDGQGLGRDKQGTAVALRAVKRSEETLGIGASTAETNNSKIRFTAYLPESFLSPSIHWKVAKW